LARGRRPDRAIWADLLTRLRTSSLAEIRSETGFTSGRLRHYVRDLTRRGLIEPDRFFSHLPTDGPGAKRYRLTRKGLEVLRGSSAQVAGIERQRSEPEGGRKSGQSSARARTTSAPSHYSQRYFGVHNLCFRMVIERPFVKPVRWDSEHTMGPSGRPTWMSRHATYEAGVHIEEAGGTITEPAGAAGHVLMLKFAPRSNGRSPAELEEYAERRAWEIRQDIETNFGCELSDPEIRGHPKHSFPHDPVARSIRAKGIALHGPIGVDDTPEPDTLEIEDAKVADAYLKLPETLERLEMVNGRLLVAIESMARSQESVLTAQGQMLRQIEEIRRREPAGMARGPREN
jgi:hypothetical protein